MPRITEEAKQERIERILDRSRRCFARFGYEGATVKRLEDEIGLSRGAIFNWFPSKEDLFFELAVRDAARLTDVYLAHGFEGMVRELLEENPAWLAVYVEFGRRLRADDVFRERWKRRMPEERQEEVLHALRQRQDSGELRDDIQAEDLARFLGVILDGLTVQRAFGFETPDAELVLQLAGDAVSGRRRRRR